MSPPSPGPAQARPRAMSALPCPAPPAPARRMAAAMPQTDRRVRDHWRLRRDCGSGSTVNVHEQLRHHDGRRPVHGHLRPSVGGGGGSGVDRAANASGSFLCGLLQPRRRRRRWGGGGDVTVGSTGSLQTTGLQAAGIFAQSVGGGGGLGGSSSSTASSGGQAAISMSLGGSGGNGGDGGTVTVNSGGLRLYQHPGPQCRGHFCPIGGWRGGSGGSSSAAASAPGAPSSGGTSSIQRHRQPVGLGKRFQHCFGAGESAASPARNPEAMAAIRWP